MLAAAPSGLLRSFFIAGVLMICSVAIFIMHYKPTVSWLPCPAAPTHTQEELTCADKCFDILKMENHTQIINNTCIVNYTFLRQQIQVKKLAHVEIKNVDDKKEPDIIIILIWLWPFGHPFGQLSSCSSLYNIEGCQLTADRGLYNKANGVIFHHRDIRWDLSNMPKVQRPAHQKWVWMNSESPSNSARNPALNNLFNITANYRRDADIMVPYSHLVEVANENKAFEIPGKDKLVCWIVSNWNPNYKRVKYFTELSKYIKIDVYGRHFKKFINHEDYGKIMSSCKFYLSFENSIHKDYMTEKLFNPLMLGTVPVFLGTTRQNCEEQTPGDSFIHVNDFPSPKELAEKLKFLDKNEEAYKQYFNWRQSFKVQGGRFGLDHACHACDHIRRHKGYKVVNNLNKWYWG